MKDTLPDRVRLGVFEVDLRAGEIRQANGLATVLPEQPFQILLMLIKRGGDIVTREAIQKTLWPNDTVVEFDHSINAAIKKLRRALGDAASEPRYIETIASRGYRLMVAVEPIASEPPEDESSDGDLPTPPRSVALASGRSPTSLIGRKVSHYRVLEVIGGGGMGLVYKAEDLKLERRVALKFLPEELAWDPIALQRFEREAKTASSLDHANICTIYEVEEYDEQPFIVMQLLEGETLRDRLAAVAAGQKSLPLAQLIDIALQICAAVQAAHQKGIIHRDIKPANIFLTHAGQVKILDFGLAKLGSATKDAGSDGIQLGPDGQVVIKAPHLPSPADSTCTRLGVSMGTAGYMSPEQVRGEKVDARSDIFSFGLVLYEMAAGRRAFSGNTAAVVHDAILKEAPRPVRELNSEVPQQLEAIIAKALVKDREHRYQTATEMGTDLEAVSIAEPSLNSRRGIKIAIASLLLITLLVSGYFYWRSHRTVKLGQADRIVLADFYNSTGDPVFDGTMKQALRMHPEQSPVFSLLPDDKKPSHKSATEIPRG